jgi:hypothetical protein
VTAVRQIMTLYEFVLCQCEIISSDVSLLGLNAKAEVRETEGKARWRFRGTFLYSRTPLIRERLGPSCKFVENYTKLTCLDVTCYWIKYSTVLRLLELQIRRGRKV